MDLCACFLACEIGAVAWVQWRSAATAVFISLVALKPFMLSWWLWNCVLGTHGFQGLSSSFPRERISVELACTRPIFSWSTVLETLLGVGVVLHKNLINGLPIPCLTIPLSSNVSVILRLCLLSSSIGVVQFSSVTQSCPTLCNPMNCSTPGLPVHHQLPEFTQTHVHWVGDAIQPSHPLSSPSPPALNPFQHQSVFQWVNSSPEGAKVLEFQL